MSEPTKEQIERLKNANAALLSAYEERGREVERLRASALPDVVPEDVDALKAEVERLRAENAALVEQFNRKQETCAEMRTALLLDAAAFARLRATWPHIEVPNANASVRLGAPRTADPGAPTCLRCKIEGLLAAAQPKENSRG